MIFLRDMNSKSFLHSSFLILLYCFLICTESFAQDYDTQKRIQELKSLLKESQQNLNPQIYVSILLEINKLDSTDVLSKKQLKLLLKNSFDKISQSESLLDSCLIVINQPCDLPLINLVIYYLNKKNLGMANNYVEKLQYCGGKTTKKYIRTILNLKSEIEQEKLLDILVAINTNADTLVTAYSAYILYQLFYEQRIRLSEICKLLSIDKNILKMVFLTNPDSISTYLAETQTDFNSNIFNNFILALGGNEDFTNYTLDELKKMKKEFFYYYQMGDKYFLEKFLTNYREKKLEWSFTIEDVIRFSEIQRNEFFKPLLQIIIKNTILSENNEIKYRIGKILYENELYDECRYLFSKINYKYKSSNVPANLIPFLFVSYVMKQDSIFKLTAKEFFISSEKADLSKLREELNWWNKNNLKIEFLEKALAIFEMDKNYFNQINEEKKAEKKKEKNYYALLIAVQDYEDDNFDLKYPINDALELRDLLVKQYNFEEDNVILLKNPKRNEIIKTFTQLKSLLTPSDNLLIFYAGHGNWDEIAEQGYWLPSDVKPKDLSEVITNTEITAYIKSLKNNHTLLISDACFSGSIFKTRDAFIEESYNLDYYRNKKARKAITSGALTPVPDKSVFIEYLIKALRENKKKEITSEELFLKFREAVINNSPINQRPLFGNINESGDEGGDFIFIQN